MTTPWSQPRFDFDGASWAWWMLLGLAVAVYACGLGGQYIPSNGDEMVYAHIARLTAASQHWLPLVSELDHMRNTKPPLLFWQAMLAGDWGNNWNLTALRTPSLVYTLLTASAVGWTLKLMLGDLRSACMAACIYLAFFCTFRYGRPFLTSAPETFWLNLPMFWLLWQRLRTDTARQAEHLGWAAHIGFGVALGLGLAYKSFALIAPAAAALWCAQILSTSSINWRSTVRTGLKVALSAALALGMFALWFALDPDPNAVWQEFVVGENAGKLSSRQGYWQTALFGAGVSIWAQLLAYVQNAGLLAFVVLGLIWAGLGQLWNMSRTNSDSVKLLPPQIVLLAWLGVWLLVFTLPSQRSARYVIPAMPALAMLLAIYWERIGRGWFVLSLLLCGGFIAVLGRVAWAAHEVGIGTDFELELALLTMVTGLIVVMMGCSRPVWTRALALTACLLVYAVFGLTSKPLNGPSGRYPDTVIAQLQGARVAVPSSFNGQFERYQFLLPGNRFAPYEGEARHTASIDLNAPTLDDLLARYDAVIWLPSQASQPEPPCLPACTVLGSRWEVKGRHQSGEITVANLWYPQTWLFRREWLIKLTTPTGS
jgi:hypothetical protein